MPRRRKLEPGKIVVLPGDVTAQVLSSEKYDPSQHGVPILRRSGPAPLPAPRPAPRPLPPPPTQEPDPWFDSRGITPKVVAPEVVDLSVRPVTNLDKCRDRTVTEVDEEDKKD